MIPNHRTHHGPHNAAHHNSLAGLENVPHGNEHDALIPPGAGDFNDGGDWEAAWIDLGGEG